MAGLLQILAQSENHYDNPHTQPKPPCEAPGIGQGRWASVRLRQEGRGRQRLRGGVSRSMRAEGDAMILAIDPGASGGIVAILGGATSVHNMPKTEGDVVELIRSYTTVNGDNTAYIEQLVKFMGQTPMSHMAVYASNHGLIKGVLMALRWRVVMIRPQEWQKSLGLGITGRQKAVVKGMTAVDAAAEKKRVKVLNSQLKRDWKNKLKSEAQRLFPNVNVTLMNADALLIAEYARRQHNGKL